ncbi:uncharacterized protein SETTUDRAFT_177055 [Exserohilum turcica Et28A]|uniref:Uncharacterized protein n=1 Tax=Exserohilum turcicum (strain 28A) TaxID=671987 RepID=R0K3U2_EXST2|nr:uncharacterized protein SETTUDRAFT_177055 [Exserohilum turcica Et28A]EOA87758.1 hypothetical protein SETTUDRAFT_177055 [Exserohilum turcica Et28A]
MLVKEWWVASCFIGISTLLILLLWTTTRVGMAPFDKTISLSSKAGTVPIGQVPYLDWSS